MQIQALLQLSAALAQNADRVCAAQLPLLFLALAEATAFCFAAVRADLPSAHKETLQQAAATVIPIFEDAAVKGFQRVNALLG